MRLFQTALDTPLDSPFSTALPVHGLHFTVYVPLNKLPEASRPQRLRPWLPARTGISGLRPEKGKNWKNTDFGIPEKIGSKVAGKW